jgi:hypothetical protein
MYEGVTTYLYAMQIMNAVLRYYARLAPDTGAVTVPAPIGLSSQSRPYNGAAGLAPMRASLIIRFSQELQRKHFLDVVVHLGHK